MRHIALIPAAGIGSRFGSELPKQYRIINGKSVLQHTVDIFLSHSDIDHIVVVISPDDCMHILKSNSRMSILKCGGMSRAESVKNGLDNIIKKRIARDEDNVLIHDAARCCLPKEAITRLIEETGNYEHGGILAIPIADTIKQSSLSQTINKTISRDRLWCAQTPQLFNIKKLHTAFMQADISNCTDEASVVEVIGMKPKLVEGDPRNIKLTHPNDEVLVKILLSSYQ